jgi:hypothetical protein
MHTFWHTLRTLRSDTSLDSEPGERSVESAILFLRGELATGVTEPDEGELASTELRLEIMRFKIEFGGEQPRNSRI